MSKKRELAPLKSHLARAESLRRIRKAKQNAARELKFRTRELHSVRQELSALSAVLRNDVLMGRFRAMGRDVAQEIIRVSQEKAKIVANKTRVDGDFEIAIIIPELRIFHRILNNEMKLHNARDFNRISQQTVTRIEV